MKKLIYILNFIIITFYSYKLYGQYPGPGIISNFSGIVTKTEHKLLDKDSVQFAPPQGLRGSLKLQYSKDSKIWGDINNNSMGYKADSTLYLRLKVTEGTCTPIYSDTSLVLRLGTKVSDLKAAGINISNDELLSKFLGPTLSAMEQSIMRSTDWQYQLQQNLTGDIYSGYMMTPTPFSNNINNVNYHMMDNWNNFIYLIFTEDIMSPWEEIQKTAQYIYPDLYSIALIMKVMAAHRFIDNFGPFPYVQYSDKFSKEPVFDSEKDIYYSFFKELDYAIDTLVHYKAQFNGRFNKYDHSNFKGDYNLWIKLANTLKLRLAIRISNVAPDTSKLIAEAVIKSPYGLLNENDGAFRIKPYIYDNPCSYDNPCFYGYPLGEISLSWEDILMGAPMESILGGYNDPRLSKFFLPVKDSSVLGQYKGIRQGIPITFKSEYVGFSKLNFKYRDSTFVNDLGYWFYFDNNDSIQLMASAESYFLKAEGALKGWDMGGTDSAFYTQGIKASFKQYELLNVAAYLNNTNLPKAYIDPKHASNNVTSGLSKATVVWNSSAPDSVKLEKIITQKWIAIFPDGQEAWSEFRRTGYPTLFPVVINNSSFIKNGEFIKRIPYTSGIKDKYPNELNKAVTKYWGGNDNEATHIWWDIK